MKNSDDFPRYYKQDYFSLVKMRLQALPRLITFDVTGTLLMTKLEQHYADVARSHGLSGLDGPRMSKTFRDSFKRLQIEHPIYGRHTGLGWENWWRNIVYDVFRDQHQNITNDKLDQIANSLIDCYSTNRCWHKYPGTIELLDSLRLRPNLILGIISNFDERLEGILDSASLRSYFSFVITSYGLGVEKPSVAIFQEALRLSSERLQDEIPPKEALHVGDRVDNDYLGARAAQWNAILINHDKDSTDDKRVEPSDVFRNFDELKTYFDKLSRKDATAEVNCRH
ncbi:rhythmically expressed gene 2 protein-like isoform X2 [Phymastichus coffea]|uniref:rhythmically expressed gene 2 protein-like isoform X2 n=1 Tax=Phymastichus coffea TaxID=108790 RepID=UPI00273C3122|nr:rhythmically expressed gene 2 protein-like isoform X2 [Phymastichus coffea]